MFEGLLLYDIRYFDIETRLTSTIYDLEKRERERNRGESNKWYIISTEQKNKAFGELHGQAQRKQGNTISPYK